MLVSHPTDNTAPRHPPQTVIISTRLRMNKPSPTLTHQTLQRLRLLSRHQYRQLRPLVILPAPSRPQMPSWRPALHHSSSALPRLVVLRKPLPPTEKWPFRLSSKHGETRCRIPAPRWPRQSGGYCLKTSQDTMTTTTSPHLPRGSEIWSMLASSRSDESSSRSSLNVSRPSMPSASWCPISWTSSTVPTTPTLPQRHWKAITTALLQRMAVQHPLWQHYQRLPPCLKAYPPICQPSRQRSSSLRQNRRTPSVHVCWLCVPLHTLLSSCRLFSSSSSSAGASSCRQSSCAER